MIPPHPSCFPEGSAGAMTHVRDDAMELGTLVVQWLPRFSHARLAGAQSLEVCDGLGHDVSKEPDQDLSSHFRAYFDLDKRLKKYQDAIKIIIIKKSLYCY